MTLHALGQSRLAWLDRVIFGVSGAGRLLGILLFLWMALWPMLGARGSRSAPSPAAVG